MAEEIRILTAMGRSPEDIQNALLDQGAELEDIMAGLEQAVANAIPDEEVEVDLDEADIDVGDIDLDDGGMQKDIDKIIGVLLTQGLSHDSNPDDVTKALNYLLTDHPEDAVEYVRNNWSRIELRPYEL